MSDLEIVYWCDLRFVLVGEFLDGIWLGGVGFCVFDVFVLFSGGWLDFVLFFIFGVGCFLGG